MMVILSNYLNNDGVPPEEKIPAEFLCVILSSLNGRFSVFHIRFQGQAIY
jgi:hypothetical protein